MSNLPGTGKRSNISLHSAKICVVKSNTTSALLIVLSLAALTAMLAVGTGCRKARQMTAKDSAQDSDSSGDPVELQTATFGAGCFWAVEAAFRQMPGVMDATVGYSGGHLANPTYEDVCTDRTGHAEVVRVRYDPARTSYEDLLEVFWRIHDPTTPNRQGPDVGSQYRSVIFFHTDQQRQAAEASKKRQDGSGKHARPIVTEILPMAEFYEAEKYHQRYLEKSGLASSRIPPKP